MSETRDQLLSEIRQSEGIDPVSDAASKYARGIKAVQGVVREQGQVMAAALDNNRSLWETQKRLRATIETLQGTCQRLEREKNKALAEVARWQDELQVTIGRYNQTEHGTVVELQEEVRKLTAANKALASALSADLMPELDSDGRKALLQELKAQHAELMASGIVPTEDEINASDYKPLPVGKGLPDV
jgi:peptidoglycan hydrolase CwlO-like protein